MLYLEHQHKSYLGYWCLLASGSQLQFRCVQFSRQHLNLDLINKKIINDGRKIHSAKNLNLKKYIQ